MMMRWPKYVPIIVALLTSLVACTTSARQLVQPGEQFLIFGNYYGECFGSCSTLFLLTESNLYIDNVDWAFEWDETGIFILKDNIFRKKPLQKEYFEAARPLLDKVSPEFSQIESGLFGAPDSYDQGGIYLALGLGDERKSWQIDVDDSFTEPAFVIEFREEFYEAYKRINLVAEE